MCLNVQHSGNTISMQTIEYLLILLIICQITGDFVASIINTLFFIQHYTGNFMM